MNTLISWAVRVIVYGAVVCSSFAVARFAMVNFELSITSDLLSKVIGAFVLLMMAIHGIGFQAHLKTLSIHKATAKLGYFQAERLADVIEKRLKSSICRIAFGVFCAVLSGVYSSILYFKGGVAASWVDVGLSLALLSTSLYVGVAGIFEFHIVASLEAELLAKEEREKRKSDLLKSLSSENGDN